MDWKTLLKTKQGQLCLGMKLQNSLERSQTMQTSTLYKDNKEKTMRGNVYWYSIGFRMAHIMCIWGTGISKSEYLETTRNVTIILLLLHFPPWNGLSR